MSKKNAKVNAAQEAMQADMPEAAVPASTPEPKPEQKLTVKAGIKSRGIRQAWYELALKYDGQPVSAFLAEGKANPPTNYTARSKYSGQPHDATRRLRRMVWLGWVTLS